LSLYSEHYSIGEAGNLRFIRVRDLVAAKEQENFVGARAGRATREFHRLSAAV
jgi:hypothetical protein